MLEAWSRRWTRCLSPLGEVGRLAQFRHLVAQRPEEVSSNMAEGVALDSTALSLDQDSILNNCVTPILTSVSSSGEDLT